MKAIFYTETDELQSLFVWILLKCGDIKNDYGPSILVRVDIIYLLDLFATILTFNPCSCGYYVKYHKDSFEIQLQSLFVWILCTHIRTEEDQMPSILVRVDIINRPNKDLELINFNPCSCGYYDS